MKKTVNGIEVPLSPQEIQLRQDEIAAHAVAWEKKRAKEEIEILESQMTPRRIREALLGDKTFMQTIDDQISNKRSQIIGE